MESKLTKVLVKALSYILVAALACVVTIVLVLPTMKYYDSYVPIRTPSGELAEQAEKLTELLSLIDTGYIEEADITAMTDAAAAAMVEATGDRWSHYISAADMEAYYAHSENYYVGIGITITPVENGFLIEQVDSNGSAKATGILPGDILIEAEGQNLVGVNANLPGSIIRGELGTEVTIKVLRGEEVLTFVVSLVNTGSTPLTDLTLTDDLGAYTLGGTSLVPLDYVVDSVSYYVDGARQATPVVLSTDPLSVTGISVPAGGNAFLVYQARVNEFASPVQGGTVTNTVTVTGASLPAPITASETVTAATEAFLTIAKSLSPTTVSEGDRLTYTFVIQNFGNTPVVATDNASVTDTFNPILSALTVTFNGAVWAEGTEYTYDEATGAFATVPGNILVPAATYTQNPTTGAWSVVPGVSTLVVVGTV